MLAWSMERDMAPSACAAVVMTDPRRSRLPLRRASSWYRLWCGWSPATLPSSAASDACPSHPPPADSLYHPVHVFLKRLLAVLAKRASTLLFRTELSGVCTDMGLARQASNLAALL